MTECLEGKLVGREQRERVSSKIRTKLGSLSQSHWSGPLAMF